MKDAQNPSRKLRTPQMIMLNDLQLIASFYGGCVSGDQILIPTPGHSARDRGTAIKFDPNAPDGVLVHVFNGTTEQALDIKAMLRRDGFLTEGGDQGQHLPLGRCKSGIDPERLARQQAASRLAQQILRSTSFADAAHPYLIRKRIPPEQLGQDANDLLVPMFDGRGQIWNIQRIDASGSKRFLTGGRTKGLFWFAGIARDVICIGEGMATMAAVRRATGHAVMAAMSAANLPAVARIAHERRPDVQLFIAADDDAAGIKAAREAAALTGARIVIPKELSRD